MRGLLCFPWEFTGNKQMRDLGVYLYVTEIASVLNYWFDIHPESCSTPS